MASTVNLSLFQSLPKTTRLAEFYTKFTSHKSPRTKAIVAIGGWNDSLGNKYSVMVNSPALRKKFIHSVMVFLEKFNFDGLDLDWEYPACWQVRTGMRTAAGLGE